jgi:hypothetical protein
MKVKERLGASIGDVRDRGRRIAQLTMELAAAELKRKAAQFGAAVGLIAAAVLFAFFLLAFLLAAIAAAVALVLPVWASLLIVAGLLLALVGVLIVVAVGLIRTARTPVPQQAVQEARADAETFRTGVRDIARRKARASPDVRLPRSPVQTPPPEPASTSAGGIDGQE